MNKINIEFTEVEDMKITRYLLMELAGKTHEDPCSVINKALRNYKIILEKK